MANEDPMRLWQEQPVDGTILPIDEIRRQARAFESRIRSRNRREYFAGALVLAAFTLYFVKFSDPLMRVGSALVVAGTIYVMVQLYRRSSPPTMPEEFGRVASVEFYRSELVRQRDLLRSVWSWYLAPLVPGLLMFTKGKIGVIALNAIVFGLVWWANQRAAARLTRKIEELGGER